MTMKEHGSYVTVYENVQLALALKEEEKKGSIPTRRTLLK